VESVASVLGIPRERVKVHVTLIGWVGFGRRLSGVRRHRRAHFSRDAGAHSAGRYGPGRRTSRHESLIAQ